MTEQPERERERAGGALTPEEWAEKCAMSRDEDHEWAASLTTLNDGVEYLVVESRMDYDPAWLSPASRKRVAALALHGQDFGFTREDLKVLRWADAVSHLVTTGPFKETAPGREALRSLAERIEGLLPPEPETPEP